MVKIRLKRLGRKKDAKYRVVVINSSSRRQGAPIAELGHYDPKTKDMKLNKTLALEWIEKGAQASETVSYLIKNCDEEGKLVYKPKTEAKLSKKAKAKLEAEKAQEAKAAQDAQAASNEAAVTSDATE